MGHDVATAGVRGPVSGRRDAAMSLGRSLLVSTAVVVGYFVLPMTRLRVGAALVLAIGLTGVTVLLAWEIWEVLRSPYPRLRAVEALGVSMAVFFACFATTYYLMSSASADNFSEPLTRLDAAYFTVTVFATVGFGDIVATTETARAVTLVQMVVDLVLIGVVVRVLLGAVGTALSHKEDAR